MTQVQKIQIALGLAKSAEFEVFFALYEQVFPQKAGNLADFAQKLQNEPCEIWFLGKSPKIQAFLYFWRVPDGLEIIDIGVHLDFRRQGLAAKLLQELRGSEPGLPIFLEVSDQNKPALKLYEKLGFKQTGKRKTYYADGTDALCLTWFA